MAQTKMKTDKEFTIDSISLHFTNIKFVH
ncbi:uncharacterized protein METZ01_LOCUS371418 [marine metagenome]|uniref:Uncharacterized protein n=1 Tax=marine metagenome TaxID=408172 RepID=A0A382T8T8_9ZZZZ